MASNLGGMMGTYCHVPNGKGRYYLSRSQPPMLAMMIELVEAKGIERALHYLPQRRKEYAFWMEGADELRRGEARRHCLRLDDGTLLNRYWDDRDTPRDRKSVV